MKTLRLSSGIELAYTEEGSGSQTMLMLHGMGSTREAWRKLIAGLKDRYRCIAIDLPNYGQSSDGDFPFTMSYFASVIWEFLQAKGIDSVQLCGHSMGGQIALVMALQRPFAVEKLFLFSPAGFETFASHEKLILKGFYAAPNMMALSKDQIRQNFEANFFQFPADAEFMVQERYRLQQTPRYESYCRMIPKCASGMLDEPVLKFLPSIAAPAMVFFGLQDQLIPNRLVHPTQTTKQVAQKGVSRMPIARLHLLDRCGHFPHWERVEEVLTWMGKEI
ncbi:MAG: alpha/beta hydrolase [Saprospirales bacterium]|nr:alpha/beta hydrolase [Saprospirales bacterium]